VGSSALLAQVRCRRSRRCCWRICEVLTVVFAVAAGCKWAPVAASDCAWGGQTSSRLRSRRHGRLQTRDSEQDGIGQQPAAHQEHRGRHPLHTTQNGRVRPLRFRNAPEAMMRGFHWTRRPAGPSPDAGQGRPESFHHFVLCVKHNRQHPSALIVFDSTGSTGGCFTRRRAVLSLVSIAKRSRRRCPGLAPAI
jgi:hypothetical protein